MKGERQLQDVCDRAIDKFDSESARAFAYFTKGRLMLLKYDPAGIEYMYKAMDASSNFIEDAIDMIGDFSCLLGLEEELEKYRENAPHLMQNRSDVFDKMDRLGATDKLVPETLEGDMLQELVDFMVGCSEGVIEKIYLVRKIIDKDHFTSAFVIYIEPGTDAETEARVMHIIFERLDTGYEWQFSLFTYDRNTEKAVRKVKNSCVWSRDGSGK